MMIVTLAFIAVLVLLCLGSYGATRELCRRRKFVIMESESGGDGDGD